MTTSEQLYIPSVKIIEGYSVAISIVIKAQTESFLGPEVVTYKLGRILKYLNIQSGLEFAKLDCECEFDHMVRH